MEMEGWPRMERMMDTFGATVSRALLESFYATPSTEGLSVIFNRCRAQSRWSSPQAASAHSLLGLNWKIDTVHALESACGDLVPG